MLGDNPGKSKLLGEGAVAEVYALSEKWVCKRPKPGQKEALEQERALLQAVKERWPKGLPLPVPEMPAPAEKQRLSLPPPCQARESILIQENLSACCEWEKAWEKVGKGREKWTRWRMGALFLERYALLLATLHEVGFLQGPDRKLEDCRLCAGTSSPCRGLEPSGGGKGGKTLPWRETPYLEEGREAFGASGPSSQFSGSAQESFFAGASTDRFTEHPSVPPPTDEERLVILDWNVVQRRKDGETKADWEDRCREDALQVLYLWWRWAAPEEVRATPPSTADDWRWQVHRREWGDWITDMLRFYVFRGDLRSLARDAYLLRRFLETLPEVLSSGPDEGAPSVRRSIQAAWSEWHSLVSLDPAGTSLESEDLERLIATLISTGLGLYLAAALEGRTGSAEEGGQGRAYYRQVASWYEKVDKALRSRRRTLERAYGPGDLDRVPFENRDIWKDLETLEQGLERLPFFFRNPRPLLEYRVLTVFEDFLRTQKHFREARRRWQGLVFGFTADAPPGRRWLGWPRQSIPSGLKPLWWLAQCFAGAPCPQEGQQRFSSLLYDLATTPLEQRQSAAPPAQELARERANALLDRLSHGEGDGRQVWEQVIRLGQDDPLSAALLRAWNERIEHLARRFFLPPTSSTPPKGPLVAFKPFAKDDAHAQGSDQDREMRFLSWEAWQTLSPKQGWDLLTAHPALERFVVHSPASEPTLVQKREGGKSSEGAPRKGLSWVDRATLQFDLLSREHLSLRSSWQKAQSMLSELSQEWQHEQQALLRAVQRLQESLQENRQAFRYLREVIQSLRQKEQEKDRRGFWKQNRRLVGVLLVFFLVTALIIVVGRGAIKSGRISLSLGKNPTSSLTAEVLSSPIPTPTPTTRAPMHLRAQLALGQDGALGAYPHLVGSVRPYRLTLTDPTARSYAQSLSLTLNAEPPGAVEYCSGPGPDTCRALPQKVMWAPDQPLHLRLIQPTARLTLHSATPGVQLTETLILTGIAWESLQWSTSPKGPRIPLQPVWRIMVTGPQGESYPAPVLAAPWAPEEVWLPGVEALQIPQPATLTWGPYTLTLTVGAGTSGQSTPQAWVQWAGHTAPVEGGRWVCAARIIRGGYVWRWEPKVDHTTLMVGDANAIKAMLQALPNRSLCVSVVGVGEEEKNAQKTNVTFRSFTLPGWVWEARERDSQGQEVNVLKFHPYRVGAPEALTLENTETLYQEMIQDQNGYRLTEEDKKALGLGAEAPAQVWFVSLRGWVSIKAIETGK